MMVKSASKISYKNLKIDKNLTNFFSRVIENGTSRLDMKTFLYTKNRLEIKIDFDGILFS